MRNLSISFNSYEFDKPKSDEIVKKFIEEGGHVTTLKPLSKYHPKATCPTPPKVKVKKWKKKIKFKKGTQNITGKIAQKQAYKIMKSINGSANLLSYDKSIEFCSQWVKDGKELPKIKTSTNTVKKEYKLKFKESFYTSDAWRALRYKAFKLYGRTCLVCGAVPGNGVILHVDHVKPRSLYPELELDIKNLQILCEACNMGKSNRDSIDWRK